MKWLGKWGGDTDLVWSHSHPHQDSDLVQPAKSEGEELDFGLPSGEKLQVREIGIFSLGLVGTTKKQ